MNNISQTSKDLKKKLSFNDYSTPSNQQDSEQVSQIAGAPVGQLAVDEKNRVPSQNTSVPARQDASNKTSLTASATSTITGAQLNQQDGMQVNQHASKPVGQHTSDQSNPLYGESLGQRTVKAAGQHNSKLSVDAVPKIKATFYLSDADNQALTDMYIKRLQEKNKTDKSALIAEAIRLLYKREMR